MRAALLVPHLENLWAMLAWPLLVGDRAHWLYPWNFTVLLVVAQGPVRRGTGVLSRSQLSRTYTWWALWGSFPGTVQFLGL